MKTNIVAPPLSVGDAGHDMLAGVVLHQIEAAFPVNLPLHLSAGLQRAVTGVDYPALTLVDLQYLDRPKDAQVIGLTAPLGVESGLVQYYVIASLALYTGLYMGGESGQKWVLFVELFHGHVLSLYFLYHSTLGVERQIGKMFRLRI